MIVTVPSIVPAFTAGTNNAARKTSNASCKTRIWRAGLLCSQGGVKVPTGGMQASLRARELPPIEGC